jgi:hypothetical protein
MPVPSLYLTTGGARAWNVARAAAYGAGVGAAAGLFKTFEQWRTTDPGSDVVVQVLAAALAFALLCAGAATLRNFLAGRVIWHQ